MWPLPTEATDGQPQPVRLRQACDYCTAAKVRCDKGHPACQRCVDGEQLCQYSASRRYGKRAKRAHPEEPSTASSCEKENPSACPQSSVPDTDCSFMAGLDDLPAESNDANDEAAETAAFVPSMELDVFGDWASCQLPLPPTLEETNYLLLCDQWMKAPEFGGPAMERPLISNLSLNAQTLPLQQSSSVKDIEHVLTCEARAITVLRSLHYSPTLQSAARQDSHSGERPTGAVNAKPHKTALPVHSMDALLSANKAAMKDLTQMLECGCAEDPHIALLHTTILSKVLFWYKVAVTGKYHDESIKLLPMKIQFGMLDLDDDDYTTLHRAAFLRELHKARSVIQAFEVRSASHGSSLCNDTSSWCGLVIRMIDEELQRIIHENEENSMARS